MKNKPIRFFLFLFCVLVSNNAVAAVDAASLSQLLISKMTVASATLSSTALIALGGFATLQLFITNYGLLKSGADIESAVAKFAAGIAWVGVCIYIISNGPGFISGVGNEFFSIPGLSLPTVGTVMSNTAKTAGVIGALAIPIGVASNTLGMFMVYLLLGTIGIGCFFAFKIFMLQLELGLIVMLSPLSFAFLGLNALKDQGIAPFKSLISLIYRVMIIGVILSAFSIVDDSVNAVFKNLSLTEIVSGGVGTVMDTLVAALGAYLLLAYLLFKSDSIAASLASGSTNMGTADVASAAAAGAAAGAAIATGGVAGAGAAKSGVSSVSDMMKKLGGGGGPSVSNAGGGGGGGGGGTGAKPSMMSTAMPKPESVSSGGAKAATAVDPNFGTSKQKDGYDAGPGGQYGAAEAPKPESGDGGSGGAPMRSESPGNPDSSMEQQIKGDAERVESAMNTPGGDPIAAADKRSRPGGTNASPAQSGKDTAPSSSRGSQDTGLLTPSNGDYAAALGGSGGPGSTAGDGVGGNTPGDSPAANQPPASAVPEGMATAQGQPPSSDLQKPESSSSSAEAAGITTSTSDQLDKMSKSMASLTDEMAKMKVPEKPSFLGELGKTNQHIAQEKAATVVSINTHAD